MAASQRTLLSASGSSSLLVHDTLDLSFPLKQTIPDAHRLGCHHICTSENGLYAASAGFGGEVKIWELNKATSEWTSGGEITGPTVKPGEVWAIALSEDGGYLAGTTNDGRINIWDVSDQSKSKIREYDTGSAGSGSFGMCVDISRDSRYTASGHQNGSIYVFNNDTGRIVHSLPGKALPIFCPYPKPPVRPWTDGRKLPQPRELGS